MTLHAYSGDILCMWDPFMLIRGILIFWPICGISHVLYDIIQMCLLMNVMMFRDSCLRISMKLVRKSICAQFWRDR